MLLKVCIVNCLTIMSYQWQPTGSPKILSSPSWLKIKYNFGIFSHKNWNICKFVTFILLFSNKPFLKSIFFLIYLLQKVRSNLCSKANGRAGWWKRKFALLWIPATVRVRKQTPVQRLSSLPLSVSVEELLLTEEEATYRNSTVNLDCHLEIGHQSSWLFQVVSSSVFDSISLRLILRDYSSFVVAIVLVIMQLTSIWWRIQYL